MSKPRGFFVLPAAAGNYIYCIAFTPKRVEFKSFKSQYFSAE